MPLFVPKERAADSITNRLLYQLSYVGLSQIVTVERGYRKGTPAADFHCFTLFPLASKLISADNSISSAGDHELTWINSVERTLYGFCASPPGNSLAGNEPDLFPFAKFSPGTISSKSRKFAIF